MSHLVTGNRTDRMQDDDFMDEGEDTQSQKQYMRTSLYKWLDLLKKHPHDSMAFYWREMVTWYANRLEAPLPLHGACKRAYVGGELEEENNLSKRVKNISIFGPTSTDHVAPGFLF